MAIVKENTLVQDNIYCLTVKYMDKCKMGQFFMLRAWDYDPLLSRPISIFDYNNEELVFMYQVLGRGTKKLSQLKAGDEITLNGPYGNGFPYLKDTDIILIGGGIGIAPLFYAARELKKIDSQRKISAYLGFRNEFKLLQSYNDVADEVIVDIGGKITDLVDFNTNSVIFTCGPKVMMESVIDIGIKNEIKVYASVEERMACGVGACLGCTCKTVNGNKKTCKDGPVFLGEELIL